VSSPRFYLPEAKRASPWWTVASLVVHVAIAAVLVSVAGPSFRWTPSDETTVFTTLMPPDGTPADREFAMPAYEGTPEGVLTAGGEGGRFMGVLPSPRIDSVLPPRAPAFLIAGRLPPATRTQSEDTTLAPGPPGYRLVGPQYGDGRVWVRASEAELGVVGPSPDRRTHAERIEMALRERMKAYIDTMPRDSFALPPPPRWTTEIGDDQWGIDGQWIYLGDFKIPTALLALIPLPQGNYDQAQAAAELQRMRDDIISAARRAETAAEFRNYVQELRKRRDAEREAERAKGDTVIAAPDPRRPQPIP
jgi:hypothetical protein